MITDFHLNSLKKRFPIAYNEYISQGGTSEWNTLCKWIESKGYDSRYYAISLKKIQNKYGDK